MNVPSIVSVIICAMDVVFNFFMIFPTRTIEVFGTGITCPGFGLGVLGAAIGSLAAWMLGTLYLIYYICRVSGELRLSFAGRWLPTERVLKKALKIGSPIGLERIISCAAQITSTVIVAPLGTVAIAANTMGIIIESLCYMPGYGIGEAATTLIGQSVGAQREDLIRRFALITLMLGVGTMSVLAIVMYITAPDIMTLMTPDIDVQHLTTRILRIEAFAEPLFATSIICYGIFVGMGDTLIPSIMQLGSIWLIRIPFAALVAAQWGLTGVWIAMAAELSVRGIVMLIRLIKKIRRP
jgi:putative MATE family efflux protein